MVEKNIVLNFDERSKRLLELKEEMRKRKENFALENKDLILEIENANVIVEDLKEKISVDVIEEFKKTGNKKLDFGFGIRVGTELLYDREVALDWAKHHSLCLLLDEKSFESLAKSQNLDFVKKEEKITATFPKELKLENENE